MEKWEEALEQQERDMELEEARKRAENGYVRLLDEFRDFVDYVNPYPGGEMNVSKVFTAIFDEFFMPGYFEEEYTTQGLDFVHPVGDGKVIGSYRGQSFMVNARRGTLKWLNVDNARKALGFMVEL